MKCVFLCGCFYLQISYTWFINNVINEGMSWFLFQVSRSIGDVYLKKPEFNRDPIFQQFGNPIPLRRPVMTAEPSILNRKLKPQDLFLIFASDGLWEQLSDEAVVDIVFKSPRAVSALLKLIYVVFFFFFPNWSIAIILVQVQQLSSLSYSYVPNILLSSLMFIVNIQFDGIPWKSSNKMVQF